MKGSRVERRSVGRSVVVSGLADEAMGGMDDEGAGSGMVVPLEESTSARLLLQIARCIPLSIANSPSKPSSVRPLSS